MRAVPDSPVRVASGGRVAAIIRPLRRLRMLSQKPRSLPDREVDSRSMSDGFGEKVARLLEIVASIEQAIDLRTVFCPLL